MKVINRALTIPQQQVGMRQLWPEFKSKKSGNFISWTGVLSPDKIAYTVKIDYTFKRSPKVWVLKPELTPPLRHVYPDKSLCLYYPFDPVKHKWTPSKSIALTIVPWTSEWLYCYELWVATQKWAGIEAPHDEQKIRDY
jgi:hypothetical protein